MTDTNLHPVFTQYQLNYNSPLKSQLHAQFITCMLRWHLHLTWFAFRAMRSSKVWLKGSRTSFFFSVLEDVSPSIQEAFSILDWRWDIFKDQEKETPEAFDSSLLGIFMTWVNLHQCIQSTDERWLSYIFFFIFWGSRKIFLDSAWSSLLCCSRWIWKKLCEDKKTNVLGNEGVCNLSLHCEPWQSGWQICNMNWSLQKAARWTTGGEAQPVTQRQSCQFQRIHHCPEVCFYKNILRPVQLSHVVIVCMNARVMEISVAVSSSHLQMLIWSEEMSCSYNLFCSSLVCREIDPRLANSCLDRCKWMGLFI